MESYSSKRGSRKRGRQTESFTVVEEVPEREAERQRVLQ